MIQYAICSTALITALGCQVTSVSKSRSNTGAPAVTVLATGEQIPGLPVPAPTPVPNDKHPPHTSANSQGGIFDGPQKVTLICEDASGCQDLAFTVNGVSPSFDAKENIITAEKGKLAVTLYLGEANEAEVVLLFKSRDVWLNEEKEQRLVFQFQNANVATPDASNSATLHWYQGF